MDNRRDWIGADEVFDQLEDCIRQRVNACVMGPQGSGKTSLLNCFFSLPVRRQLAARGTLVCLASLAGCRDDEKMCQCLQDQLFHAARRQVTGDEKADLLAELEGVSGQSAITRLQQAMEILHDYGYFILLVMDNFEAFTSSPTVTMEHHETFRSLIEGGKLQCIVATDYDLSQDSLPADVRGSYFLQKFTSSFGMRPFTAANTARFIRARQEGSPVQLEEKTIQIVHSLSGGIPWVVEAVAEAVWDSLEKGEGKLDGAQATRQAYEACLPIFQSWCKLLTGPQLEVLEQLAAQPGTSSQLARLDFNGQAARMPAVAALVLRGLLRPVSFTDSQGRTRVPNEYEVTCNSLLFQRFCRQGGPKQAAEANPLRHKADPRQEAAGQPVQYIVQGDLYMSGAQNNSQNVTAENVQIVQGITAEQMLQMLGQSDSPLDFARMLRQRMAEMALGPAPVQAKLPEAVYAQQQDERFGQMGQQLLEDVEVDAEQDLVNVPPDTIETLEQRFASARHRRPDLTDEMLAQQSERCRFYLKMSVVVEDALSLLGDYMEEYSPQLVLYGKALEQSLQDNLYELFHKEPRLRIYDPVARRDTPDGSNTFGQKGPRRTFIGNYAYMIGDQKDYLDSLCSENGLEDPPVSGWRNWWSRLQADIQTARLIRNLADHADDISPDQNSLDEMCGLLLGSGEEEGILDRLTRGRQLLRRLFPPALDPAELDRLVGSVHLMECIERKSNGGLRGRLCPEGYPVNVSPRQVRKYLESRQGGEFAPAGRQFQVLLTEFRTQDDRNFFAAELVGES